MQGRGGQSRASRSIAATMAGALLLALIGTLPARADGSPLERAAALRKASGDDWNAGRYADAVDKLRRVAEIYATTDGETPKDDAVVDRALVWNLARDGRVDEAIAAFDDLLALDLAAPGVENEVGSAYLALYQTAEKMEDVEAIRSLLEGLRTRLLAHDLELRASQALHDLGFLFFQRRHAEEAAAFYEQAIEERTRLHDEVGRTWSLNNLSHLRLEGGDLDAALPPLLSAVKQVHELRIVAPQASVAVNLNTVLDRLAEAPPTETHTAWLWNVATVVAASEAPEIVPCDLLLRRASEAAAAIRGEAGALRAAQRVAALDLAGQPLEIVARTKLDAAFLAAEAGGAKEAAGWLTDLDVGKGPAAPWLAARLHTVRALVASRMPDPTAFDQEARLALAAWRMLGARGDQEEALRRIADRAEAMGLPGAPEFRDAYDTLRRQGKPGGAGGTAVAGGQTEGYRQLPLDGVLFEIRAIDGRLRIRDRIARREKTVDVRWAPQAMGLNGLSLVLFGGWVKIQALAYGASAAVGGQPGSPALDALGAMRPVPGKGALLILKNGAVTYGEGEE